MFLSASARPSALSIRLARREIAGLLTTVACWNPSGALELVAITVAEKKLTVNR